LFVYFNNLDQVSKEPAKKAYNYKGEEEVEIRMNGKERY
jgi:hypothetical protein